MVHSIVTKKEHFFIAFVRLPFYAVLGPRYSAVSCLRAARKPARATPGLFPSWKRGSVAVSSAPRSTWVGGFRACQEHQNDTEVDFFFFFEKEHGGWSGPWDLEVPITFATPSSLHQKKLGEKHTFPRNIQSKEAWREDQAYDKTTQHRIEYGFVFQNSGYRTTQEVLNVNHEP